MRAAADRRPYNLGPQYIRLPRIYPVINRLFRYSAAGKNAIVAAYIRGNPAELYFAAA